MSPTLAASSVPPAVTGEAHSFNHVNFTSLDTPARFNGSGGQTNPTFGQYSADASPRRMVLAAKFRF